MTIVDIKKNKLYLSNEEIIDITPFVRGKYGLKKGMDIVDLYDEIVYESAVEKGIFLLSLKDRTKKEIRLKLKEKYKNYKMVEKAVNKLEELGYVNDFNFTVNFIKIKKYGKNRLKFDLKLKGVDENTINEAYEYIFENERDFIDIDEEKLEKSIMKNIKKERIKLIQYLMRQGFNYHKIVNKLKEYDENGGFFE